MKNVSRIMVLTVVLMLAAGNELADSAPRCAKFCVSMLPKEGKVGQVFLVRGRYWLPRTGIRASYGPPCFSGSTCVGSRQLKRFRTDRRGGFEFYFENGPGDCSLNGIGAPTGFGRGPIIFRQIGKQKAIRRTVPVVIND